jgi:hypothetical protein
MIMELTLNKCEDDDYLNTNAHIRIYIYVKPMSECDRVTLRCHIYYRVLATCCCKH